MKALQFLKIVCLLCAAMLPAAVQAQLTFTTNNGTITITGYTGSASDVTIPDTIDGLPVTSIGDGAFYGSYLNIVLIGNNVTNIGDYAFAYCPYLTEVAIGTNVTSIGDYAFAYCSYLTEAVIPNSVTSIGDYAYYGGAMSCVAFGTNVTSIGDYAFANGNMLSVYFNGNPPHR
jgi:hypothetical protein